MREADSENEVWGGGGEMEHMGFILHNTVKYNFYKVCSHLKCTTNGFIAHLSCVFSLLVSG